MTLPKWTAYGPGLDHEGHGGRFVPAIPMCHEHCVARVSTGCPIAAHAPDWTLGYQEVEDGEVEDGEVEDGEVVGNDEAAEEGEFWLCPLRFDWYREALGLRLDPSVAYPRRPQVPGVGG